jgi:hypothetical protein
MQAFVSWKGDSDLRRCAMMRAPGHDSLTTAFAAPDAEPNGHAAVGTRCALAPAHSA